MFVSTYGQQGIHTGACNIYRHSMPILSFTPLFGGSMKTLYHPQIQFVGLSSGCFLRAARSEDVRSWTPREPEQKKRARRDSNEEDDSDDAREVKLLRDTERQECLEACMGSTLIVFNLFALAAWHIAEYLRVPCIAVSPYAMPSSPPYWFEKRFKKMHRKLYTRLQVLCTTE
jgi:hypothetical protein